MIRALFVTLLTFAYTLMVGPPLLIYAFLTRKTDPIYRVGVLGAKMAVWLAGVQVEIAGLEKIPPNRALVFMANHQGNCDPPALLSYLPPVLVMVKKEFFRVPVLGRAMLAHGFVRVDRRNRDQAIAAVEQAVSSLKAGKSFMAFPEGTRSLDGRLQPFKKGVFVMAIKAGVPIVPVSISGSSKIMPKGKFAIYPGRVRISVHNPVPTAGLGMEDRLAIMERVRQAILSGLAEDEWPLERASESPASRAPAQTSSPA